MPASVVPSWLYLPGIAAPGGTFVLPEDEAHYVARVCRARPGERATGTDGAGTVADLELVTIARRVEVRVLARRHEPRTHAAYVLCGAPEGARADWLVEKLAELGVSQLRPLECARANWRGTRLDRARKLAIAALRQSRSPWLLEVCEPLPIPDAIEALAGLPADSARWIADAHADRGPAASAGPAVSVAAIGAAPGFAPEERERFVARGFVPVRLARGRLRTETAAVAWAAAWAAANVADGPAIDAAGPGLTPRTARP